MKNKLKKTKKIDLKKKVMSLDNTVVKIGFPEEKPETKSTDQEGVSAIFKAVVNNFGLGVPKRPFMKIAYNTNKKEYRKIVKKALKKLHTLNFPSFANKLGLKGQGDVQKAIIGLKTPPNDPMTIEQKGSSNPLIDTGHMAQSVTYQVSKK